MNKAWLIYNKEDYQKNTYFAQELIKFAGEKEIDLKLVLREEITLGVEENILFAAASGIKEQPAFVINRSRDSFAAQHFELMGIRVYNSYYVTWLCNHKSRTHQWMNKLGFPSVDMLFMNKRYFNEEVLNLSYPLVLKSVSGHGGSEVFMCRNQEDVMTALSCIPEEEFLVQKLCDNPGVDVRVFAIGEQIVGAVKRESQTDFRSNYSLGGKASLYELSAKDKKNIQMILKHLKSDFIGLDFMINQDGSLLFNEIEDVVGSRTLYKNASVDTAKEYIHYIARNL